MKEFFKRIGDFFLAFVVSCLLILAVLFITFDDAVWCLEHGMVWDEYQKICRDDCITWNKEDGCVPDETVVKE